jgi:hypothetical protein
MIPLSLVPAYIRALMRAAAEQSAAKPKTA